MAFFMDPFFDHARFLADGEAIAALPPSGLNREVAVIGAGAAGLAAAYELLRAGLRPVIFEAGRRVGGRLESRPFTEPDGSPSPVFAEMGAMRLPLSSGLFFQYANRFGLRHAPFPNPLTVPTLVHYQNQSTLCHGPAGLSEQFARINTMWQRLLETLVAPLQEQISNGDLACARTTWQSYLQRFSDVTFFKAVKDLLPWGNTDVDRFGALGLGTGGFGPLYPLTFMEIMRVLAHRLESDQRLMLDGVEKLADAFLGDTVETPLGRRTLRRDSTLLLEHAVTGLRVCPATREVEVLVGSRGSGRRFPAVIVATTAPAMDLMGLTLLGGTGEATVLQADERSAIRRLHHIASSKLFIRTRTKFWLDREGRSRPGMPQVVLTDELPKALYLFDYPHTDQGVVCVSYTWEADAVRLSPLDPQTRFRAFRRALADVHAGLASELEPLHQEVLQVDWHNEPFFHGAFKLNMPGQDADAASLAAQYLRCLEPERDPGVYLAGDSISWYGGWVEGALMSAINAACAVLHRLGARVRPGSPLEQKASYQY